MEFSVLVCKMATIPPSQSSMAGEATHVLRAESYSDVRGGRWTFLKRVKDSFFDNGLSTKFMVHLISKVQSIAHLMSP